MDPASPRVTSPDPRKTTRGPAPQRLWRELLGEQLRTVRRQRGETLKAVARRAKVSLPYLSEVERGLKEPSSEIIGALCGALDLSLTDLAAGVHDLSRHPASSKTGFELAA